MRNAAIAIVIVVFAAAVLLGKRTAVVNAPSPATIAKPAVEAGKFSAQTAVAQALAEALGKPEEDASLAIADLVAEWSLRDPNALFQALLQMEAGPTRANALIQLAGLWAASDPKLAAETFYAQTSEEERKRGVAQAISKWAKSNPGEARKWLEDVVDDQALRAQLRKQLYAAWALNDPAGAVQDAITSNAIGGEVNAIFSSWAASDLDEAVKFHDEKLPADLQKQTRANLLLAAAAQKSPLAGALFEDFVASQPAWGELADMGKVLSATDPKLAMLIADKLSPSPEADLLRHRIASLHPGEPPAMAVLEDSIEAGIPSAPRRIIPAAGAEPSNSIPR
jgi:hypothetical protein